MDDKKLYRADLHVHSSFSNKASIWALKKINCPESYTSPEFIYQEARRKGMDYVTITDHNTIEGGLRIAHLPGTFLSSEITAYFPENGCKVHVVVLGISESLFPEIMELRKNIYEMTAFLRERRVLHFIAHPLYDTGKKLTMETVEKILLLFEAVEVKNGTHSRDLNRIIRDVVASLTPEIIDTLACKHNLEPSGDQPWHKICLGGSDDHSGFSIARAHTACTEGATLDEFFRGLRNRCSEAQGEDGDALTLAHSIYGTAYQFYRERVATQKKQFPFVKLLLDTHMRNGAEKQSLVKRIRLFARKSMPEFYENYDGKPFEAILDREVRKLLKDRQFLSRLDGEDQNRKIFTVTSYLANRMVYIYTRRLMNEQSGRGLFESFLSFGSIGLVHLLIAPYYIAYCNQSRSKELLAKVEARLGSNPAEAKQEKIALFTDTLDEINGVAITIKRLAGEAERRGIDLTIITCSEQEPSFRHRVRHFESMGDFCLPEYPELKLPFPPILDIIDYVQREGFTRIHSSTPGTLGLMALAVAKMLDLPLTGTYHTDIPRYVGSLTDDAFLEHSAWKYIIWFYNQMEEVTVPSRSTEQQLCDQGLEREKVRPLPRWVDPNVYCPAKRDETLWKRYSLDGEVKLLYVGRISKEKNLELLADAFMDVVKEGSPVHMVIVGDGPYKNELKQKLDGYPVLFTGYKDGEELSALYASSDIFVFPSTTDTFGNVVLEAQASGLPVIVSDEGGPKELMRHGETGWVVKSNDRHELVSALKGLVADRNRIRAMGSSARRFIEEGAISPDDTYSTIFNQRSA